MDIEEAVDAVCVINPKVVFPMHQSKQNPAVIKREVVLCPAMLSTIASYIYIEKIKGEKQN